MDYTDLMVYNLLFMKNSDRQGGSKVDVGSSAVPQSFGRPFVTPDIDELNRVAAGVAARREEQKPLIEHAKQVLSDPTATVEDLGEKVRSLLLSLLERA